MCPNVENNIPREKGFNYCLLMRIAYLLNTHLQVHLVSLPHGYRLWMTLRYRFIWDVSEGLRQDLQGLDFADFEALITGYSHGWSLYHLFFELGA